MLRKILSLQAVRCKALSACFQLCRPIFVCLVVLGPSESLRATNFYLEGDAIGPDSSATDNTGGFTAVEQNGENLGQPAILVSFEGFELLKEFRVIVFGLPAANGNLLFDEFHYKMKLWEIAGYISGADPEYEVDLGEPVGINLVANGPTEIVPSTPFGTAGISGNGATTYDFVYDLTNLPEGGPAQDLFSNPLEPGYWVIGFQSEHETSESGIFRVSGSAAAEGPVPLFSRGDSVPRGVLGGQDFNNIAIRWGITLAAEANYPGDFDFDFDVDDDDGVLWEATFGKGPIADADEDRDVDGADFLAWQANFGSSGIAGNLSSDFNSDGQVDGNDLDAWGATFGVGPFADADNDKDVDGADLLLWQQNYGIGLNALASSKIPEPASEILLLGGIYLGRRRLTNRKQGT